MHQFLLERFGPRIAQWGTIAWYTLLLGLVFLSFGQPGGEFRYGQL